jgi:hypothetical protein
MAQPSILLNEKFERVVMALNDLMLDNSITPLDKVSGLQMLDIYIKNQMAGIAMEQIKKIKEGKE